MSRRRVLLVTTELLPAGAERIVFEIATRLPADRWQVRVASLRSPEGVDGRVADDLRAAGIEVEHTRMRSKLDPRGAGRFVRMVRRFRPHVLHSHLFHANLASRLLGQAAGAQRVISTLHIVERRRLPARPILQRLTAWRDHATVCVSQAVADDASRRLGVSAEALRVIPNGIDLARFGARHDRSDARRALGLPRDGHVIGAVGRLTAQKGLGDLLAAFDRLATQDPGVHLVLAGTGEEERALQASAARLAAAKRVRFLGFREDVPRVLAALDVFCMPSHWEGFGLSLAEALASGTPCVATDVDSLPEVLGEAGVLVPARSPQRLAEALEALLTDPGTRADLARRGPQQAARFEVGRMVAAYEALYDEVLAR